MKQSACIETLYTELPFLERFSAAKKDGFDYVEFWSRNDKKIKEIEKAAQDADIEICSFNGDADHSLVDPTHKQPYLDYLKGSFEVAKALGIKNIAIHSNALDPQGKVVNYYDDLSYTTKLASMVDTLQAAVELAEEYQICMNLEPLNIKVDHVGNFLRDTQTAAEICQLLDSPYLKVLYDIYHMQLNEGNICDTLTAYLDQIGHIHVADAPGRHEPGTGELYFPNIYRHLDSLGYKGIVGYELFPKNNTPEAVKAIRNIQSY